MKAVRIYRCRKMALGNGAPCAKVTSMADDLIGLNRGVYDTSNGLWHPEHGELELPGGWEFLPVWRRVRAKAGEGRRSVLRAVVGVAAPGAPNRFAAIIDTGGPITVAAAEVLSSGRDPIERNETMMLRLGDSTNDVPLYDLTSEVRPSPAATGATPVSWRGVVAVLDPWPRHGTAVILRQRSSSRSRALFEPERGACACCPILTPAFWERGHLGLAVTRDRRQHGRARIGRDRWSIGVPR
jgi:hypothetical protein